MSFHNIIDIDQKRGMFSSSLFLAEKTTGMTNSASECVRVCFSATNGSGLCQELYIEYRIPNGSNMSFRKILNPNECLEIGCLHLCPLETIFVTVVGNIFAGDYINVDFEYIKE